MKYILYSVCLMGLALAACNPKPSPLVRSWQAVRIYNANFEQMAKDQQNTIDTMGRNTTDAGEDSLYGTHNIDSLRILLVNDLQSSRAIKLELTKNFGYDFRPDSVVIIHTIDMTDSARWYFEEPDVLVLDELKLKGYGETTRFRVLELNDTVLRVVLNAKDLNTITTTFHPKK